MSVSDAGTPYDPGAKLSSASKHVSKAEISSKPTEALLLFSDSCQITRECLTHMLATRAPDFVVICPTLANAEPRTRLDLVLLNIRAARIGDPETIAQVGSIRAMHGDAVPIVVLSDVDEPSLVHETLHRFGIRGYVTTSVSPALMVAVLRLVLAGGTYVPFNLLSSCVPDSAPTPAATRQPSPPITVEPWLTARELDVVELLREAKPNKIIAHMLNISENTTKVHVHNIMKKLRLTNRTQVALLDRRPGSGGAAGPTRATPQRV